MAIKATTEVQKIAASTRWYRQWHKTIGIFSLLLFVLIATTGLLLAWKKNSGGYLLADTQKGVSDNAKNWLSLHDLKMHAVNSLDSIDPKLDKTIDRIDIRPDKGIAKFRFKQHYQAIQVDLTTGAPLLIETRRADFIEQLHDGSILDQWLGVEGPKLVYSTLAGLSLLFLSLSGFWLWYNPGRIKRKKLKNNME